MTTTPTDRRCGTCAFWRAKYDKRGRKIVAGQKAYACDWSVGEPRPNMPIPHPSGLWAADIHIPSIYPAATDGTTCPTWRPDTRAPVPGGQAEAYGVAGPVWEEGR